jgi:acyl-CoA synthetase (AMP-forming)/AMP-acid ligase II/thioesterase domain-containing protein
LLAPHCPPLTYSDLERLIDASAARFREAGVGHEEIIAVALPNGPEAASSFLAIASAAVCAPLNPQLTEKEHRAYLGELGAKAVVIGEHTPEVERAAEGLAIPVLRLAGRRERGAGWFDIELLEGARPGARPAQDRPAAPDDTALILPTSGTTSRPKLVPLSHGNLSISAGNIQATLRLEPADRCLNLMPLFHIHGLVGAFLSTLSAGGSMVCTPGFSAQHFLEWLAELAPTWYSAVPTIHQAVLACAGAAGGAGACRLRFVRSSSASLPPSVMAELEELFQAPVVEAYGMTEASHQMACNPLPPQQRKPGSVGLPTGIDIAVVDEQGSPLPAGAVGEILIRGATITRGYLRNEAANRDAFRDGWFRTGDQGRFDQDGYLQLTGRTKELINRGGEKIAPREIEEVLLEHPAVAQAIAFSVPHRTLGEDVGAAIVLKSGNGLAAAELRQFATERLPGFKVPRVIRFLEEAPRGPTGKLQRIGLAERLGINAADGEEFVPPQSAVEERVAQIWREVLGVERVGAFDDFFALGGDSLRAADMLSRVSLEEDVNLPHVSLYEHSSLREFAGAVASALSDPRQAGTSQQGLVPIRTSGSRPPLFCAPGHLNHFGMFCRLAQYLGADQPVYGLRLPRLTRNNAHYYLDKLASEFVAAIREMYPTGPYSFLGYCHGGFLVFEVARQLESLGERVNFLGLMDAYLGRGVTQPDEEAAVDQGGDGLRRRLGIHAQAFASRSGAERLRYLLERAVALWRKAVHLGQSLVYGLCVRRRWPVPVFLRKTELASRFAQQNYQPASYHGSLLLLRTLDNRSEAALMGWQPWVRGGAEIVHIPAHPNGPAAPESLAKYAPRLAEALAASHQSAVA